jgi:hypothetical protein
VEIDSHFHYWIIQIFTPLERADCTDLLKKHNRTNVCACCASKVETAIEHPPFVILQTPLKIERMSHSTLYETHTNNTTPEIPTPPSDHQKHQRACSYVLSLPIPTHSWGNAVQRITISGNQGVLRHDKWQCHADFFI